MEKLYKPGAIGTMRLKNRWIMLAMHTGYSNDDGSFSQRDMEFYKRRAHGGMAAITLVGAVNQIGARHGMCRLDKEEYDEGLRRVCHLIHEGNCKVIMQLYHAGRNNVDKLYLGPPPAPSPVPSPIYKVMPRELNDDEIIMTIRDFADAALRCKNNGVDCVEISASAGYLLSQFLSPLTNLRTDKWGGDEIKRMKFPSEVLKAVRQTVGPDYPVIIKISGGDMLGGYDNDYMARFINGLPKGTLDGVTVTGGWHEAPVPQISYHVTPGGFSYLAREIKEKTELPVIACNRINSPEIAEELLKGKDCDFVGAARPFLADADFVNKSSRGIPYNKCQGCNRGCIENALKKKDVCCVFNPKAGREYLKNLEDSTVTSGKTPVKKLLIVGAGPVGMEAAALAGEAGHKVTLITDEKRLGGKLHIADKPPFKQGLGRFIYFLEYEMKRNGVKVLIDTPLSQRIIEAENPDAVIFATGASPIIPELEGHYDFPRVAAEDILNGIGEVTGNNIVIIGGGSVGLETAEFLAERYSEKKITVVEMLPKAGKDLGGLKWIMMKHLKELNVQVLTSAKVVKGDGQGLLAEIQIRRTDDLISNDVSEDSDKIIEKRHIPADTVVFAVGCKPRGTLGFEKILNERNIPYYIIGDAGQSKNILDGITDAYNTIIKLHEGGWQN